MISYKPFWETLKRNNVSTYALINKHGISSATINRMKQGGGISTTALTAANILDLWDDALVYLTNQRVNRDRVRCKMIPAVYKLLKQAAGLTRFIEVTGGIQNVDRNIAKLDGVNIMEVPADMMQDQYDFSQGWATVSGSKQIFMLFYDVASIAAPIIYDTSMMSAPTAQSKGKYLYYERYYYDAFSIAERQAGFFAFMASAPALGVVAVESVAGAASGETILTLAGDHFLVGGMPVTGYDIYTTTGNAAVTLTYGAALPSGSTWVKQAPVNPITLAGQSAGTVTVAVVNHQTGNVVAGGSAVMVIKP